VGIGNYATKGPLTIFERDLARACADGLEQLLREGASPLSYKAKLIDAGIILGTFCACIIGVLWIVKEVLKSVMER
jgi:hypothetical protein